MSCEGCPIKEKCDRRLDLAIAGVVPWYCEREKQEQENEQKDGDDDG